MREVTDLVDDYKVLAHMLSGSDLHFRREHAAKAQSLADIFVVSKKKICGSCPVVCSSCRWLCIPLAEPWAVSLAG